MGSNLPMENSAELLFSKRSRGRIRLPPLSTTSTESKILNKVEGYACDTATIGCSSQPATEHLVTPKMYKHPMATSPSNLSIQFNFDEAPMHETGERKLTRRIRDIKPTRENRLDYDKRLQSPLPGESSNVKIHKGYRKLVENDELKIESERKSPREKPKQVKVGRYQPLNTNLAITSTSSPRQSRKTTPNNLSLKTMLSSNRLAPDVRLNVRNTDQRKSSIYDLREFLSLPMHKERGGITSVVNKRGNRRVLADKRPENLTKNNPENSQILKKKSSEDSVYNIFEFLALPPEQERSAIGGKGQRKVKGHNSEKLAKSKSATVSRKIDIPSVVVADWSVEDSPLYNKSLSRKPHNLPMANFPRDDFPYRSDILTAQPSDTIRRASTYDLKEFLNLPTLTRESVAKITPKDFQRLSKEYEQFLDVRRLSNTENSKSDFSRDRAMTDSETSRAGRTLSVYDIYEFLKATSSSNIKDGELHLEDRSDELNREGAAEVSARDSESPSEECDQVSKTEPEVQYDLGEFLTLLDSRKSSGTGSSVCRDRAPTNSETYREGRALSVYDIYEFLKGTSTLNINESDRHLRDEMTPSARYQQTQRTLAIDLTEYLTKSSSGSEQSSKDIPRGANESSKSHANSTYNLREFLKLPVAGEPNKTDSEAEARSTFPSSGKAVETRGV